MQAMQNHPMVILISFKTCVIAEMENFMELKHRVAIISRAASTGFSLHADKNRENNQKRVHIALEYAWSAEPVLQQVCMFTLPITCTMQHVILDWILLLLGRSHRSNQAYKPTYVILESPIPGELRFTCTVAKRLKHLVRNFV